MAWSVLAKPGTKFGPCKGECSHPDCACTREMAAALCIYCGKPIGYDTKLCGNHEKGYAHFICALEDAEKQHGAVR